MSKPLDLEIFLAYKLPALRYIAHRAPGNVLVPLTTREVTEAIKGEVGSSAIWEQWLRAYKLIRTDAAVGTRKKIRQMTITPQGKTFLISVDKYGPEAAIEYHKNLQASRVDPVPEFAPKGQTIPKPKPPVAHFHDADFDAVHASIKESSSFDPVSAPSHYLEGRSIEPLAVIEDWGLGFLEGQVVKYVSRLGRKDNTIQDAEKAKFYLDRLVENLKES